MKLPPTVRIAAALGGLVALVLAVLPAAGVVNWSAVQLTDVGLAATAGVALIVSLIAHFRHDTAPEPVAVAAAVPAFLVALLTAGNAFSWWNLSTESITSIVAAVAVILGGGGAALARQQVTPVNPPAR